jgi:hypothetical protein
MRKRWICWWTAVLGEARGYWLFAPRCCGPLADDQGAASYDVIESYLEDDWR